MNSDIKKVIVKYNDKIVGYLVEIEDNRIAFQYDEQWIQHGFSISPFSLPLDDKIYINNKRDFDGLYGVFWDSLPDGWGELLVKRFLGAKGINYDRLSPLVKLSLISGNGLGGLSYEPSQALKEENSIIDFDSFSNSISKILEEKAITDNFDIIYKMGGSSGGARPKAHVKINNEDWIVKFPCKIDGINAGEEEFNANDLARKCKINVNEFKLFPSKICTGYFGAKRFDRYNNKRLHMISLSSILETTHRLPNLDYAHLFQVIQRICCDSNDMYEAFKRMCFNVYYQNKDDHGKNFAFLYNEEKGSYQLSPAYDITKTRDKVEHEMTVNGQPNPTDNDILALAQNMDLSISKCKMIMDEIKNILMIN